MALLTELKKQMMSKTKKQLITLLCKPDEDPRFSRSLAGLSSKAEAKILRTEYARDTVVQAKLVRRVIAPILLEKMGPAGLLDDSRIIQALDNQRMLPRIGYLYTQMKDMNKQMRRLRKKMEKYVAFRGPLPPAKRIQVFGLGGSASGPLLATEIIQNQGYCAPLDIHTGYPESFHGIDADTLVVICSFSGNTEEMLYAFDYAAKRTKNLLILSLGGELGSLKDDHYPFIEIPKSDIIKPRESIGYWLSAFLFIVSSLGLARNDAGGAYRFKMSQLESVRRRLSRIDTLCSQKVPFDKNPAKQYATYFLYGTMSGRKSSQTDWQRPRVPVVLLHSADRAIGKRLANQFGETVEHPIELVVLVEDAHNEIESVATLMLEEKLRAQPASRSYTMISSRPYDSPARSHGERRAVQRMEATLKALFKEHDVDFLRIEAKGGPLMGRKLCLLKLLDYTRAYACILLGTKPLPTIFMDLTRKRMENITGDADRDLLKLLTGSLRFPISREKALSDHNVKDTFPALRHSILNRLIAKGYLRDQSGTIHLTPKGERAVKHRQQAPRR